MPDPADPAAAAGRRLALQLLALSAVCWWGVGIPFSWSWWLLNDHQLSWVLICYGWEVPVVGWAGAVLVPWLEWRRRIGLVRGGDRRAAVAMATFPRFTGLAAFLTSTLGYLAGAIQLRVFADLPYIEAAKIMIQGPVLGALLGVVGYLAAESAVRRAELPPVEPSRGGLYRRSLGIATVLAIGLSTPLFLLGLTRDQSRLEELRGHELADALAIAAADPGAFSARLAELGKHTHAFVVDRASGTVVAGDQAGTPLDQLGLEHVGRILTGPAGWFVSRDKNATVVATLPLPAARGAGQVLVAVSPFPDYARDLGRMSLITLLVMAVAVVIGVLIVRRFVRSIVDPIDRLREASARMAAGELDVATLGYIGTGEVAALARAFDRMADRVRSDEGELRAAYRRLIATQADLLQAEKLSTVGRLVSGVAHELNNPLTAILQLTDEVAGMPGLQPEDRELLGVVHQQAQRARNIVRDLLAAVRAREVRRERVTVATLVDAVTRGLRPMLEARRVRLVTEVMAGVPDLDADRSGLEQVLVNLIQNAIQATSAGGAVTLTITAPETSVMFVVEDDGPGISPDVVPRVFEPFFTTKEAGEGTGLGLFVTLGIVEAHGGTIRAENRPAAAGTGARFTVTLPAALPGERPAERSGGPDAPAPIPNDGRVLIVEDEPSIRHAVRRWFQRAGWTVDEVVNGDDALARCLAAGPGEYRVIVTDLKMPGMTGVELVDRLAVVRPDLYARMVIMTGDVASPDAAALIARTDRPVVEKPFTFEALADAVGRVAGNSVSSEGR